MKKLQVSLCLVACITSSVWASDEATKQTDNPTGEPLTLPVAVAKTLQHNPELYQFGFTRQRLLAERESNDLTPGYELGIELENFAGSGVASDFDSAEITVALSSVIELGDKRHSRVAVIDAQLDRVEMERQAQTLDILGDMTSAFIRLLAAQEKQQLATEAVKLTEALHKKVQQRAKHGAASDADVLRAKSTLTQTRLRQRAMRHEIERLKVSLAQHWGESDVAFSTLRGDLSVFGQAQRFEDLYDKLKRSPAISILATERRLKEAELRLVQNDNQLDLAWQFGVRQLQESDDTALIMGVSVPLFSENRNRGNLGAVMAERDALDYQRTNQLLALHDRLFTAYSQRQQYIDAYQLLNEHVIPDLERALGITRDAYDRGRLKYQDWIVAQQELLDAKQQLIDTASAALLNQAVIEQLTAESLTK